MDDDTYKIIKRIGILSEGNSKHTKELNIISWNSRPARYDIRKWDKEGGTPMKGITLTDEEFSNLAEIITTHSIALCECEQCLSDNKRITNIDRDDKSLTAEFHYKSIDKALIYNHLKLLISNGDIGFSLYLAYNIDNSDLYKVYELVNEINNFAHMIGCSIRAHYEKIEGLKETLIITWIPDQFITRSGNLFQMLYTMLPEAL